MTRDHGALFLWRLFALNLSFLLSLQQGKADFAPNLQYLDTRHLAIPEGTLIEGGTLLRNKAGLHLFTTDKSNGVVNTSIVYYHTPDTSHPFQFVRQLICCSTVVCDGTDPRASLWAPMPSFDDADQLWHLFYVGYKSAPNNASGWYSNFDGRIYHAVSTTPGEAGIGGPYQDINVVLEPGQTSQAWEGLQGTDSISPPFRLPNGSYAAWYGSAHTETVPPAPFKTPSWWNGLVTVEKLGDPFQRMLPDSRVDLNGGGSENPVVTYIPQYKLYIAVFDNLWAEAQGFGFTWSTDGVTWAKAISVTVKGGARTPLAAFLEDDGTLTVFYTTWVSRYVWMASFNFTIGSGQRSTAGFQIV